jgi:hypothetical protein
MEEKDMSEEKEPAFDEPLARKVLAHIEALLADWRRYAFGPGEVGRPLQTWDQGVWRRVVPAKDVPRGSCGTAMCFAGWTAELAGEWLLSPQEIIDYQVMTLPFGRSLAELMVAENVAWNAVPLGTWLAMMRRDVGGSAEGAEDIQAREKRLERMLLERYTEDTPTMTVALWAADRLGLGPDPMGMFAESYDLEDLVFIVDTYARYGTRRAQIRPHLTPDERERYLGELEYQDVVYRVEIP